MARVEGLERLKRRFATLPVRVKREVKVALEKSAEELVRFQRLLAPDDPATPPPDLRSSIKWRDGRHELAVEVFTDDFKARWIEFGTVKMSAQPFFFPPYRANRRRIRGRTTRAMNKAIKRHV